MTSRSEATLSSSELCSPPSLRAPRKSLSGARWLALLLSAHFTRGLLRQVLVCLLGKCLSGGARSGGKHCGPRFGNVVPSEACVLPAWQYPQALSSQLPWGHREAVWQAGTSWTQLSHLKTDLLDTIARQL